jgi:hypothetical protein
VPTLALGVAFAIKAVANPNAVRDVFSGPQALLVTGALGVGWVLLAFVVVPRLVRSDRARFAILGVVAAGVIVLLVVPTFRDTKVVEAFPGVAKQARAAAPPVTGGAPDSGEPVALASGALRGIDHDARGTVKLYRQPDGTLVVGLEDIDIESGPDFKLYVVPGHDAVRPGDGGVNLGGLKGNQGTQFYAVPPETELTPGEWTVLVWCRAFAVPIAHATPSPV